MKVLCFYLLVLCVVVASCKQPTAQQEKIQTQVLSADTANSGDDTITFNGTNCFSQKQIFRETAVIWQASWEAFHNYQFGTNPSDMNYQNSPSFFLDTLTMATLYREVKDNPDPTGVLISYFLGEDDGVVQSIPGIAIQNIVNCTTVQNGSIYIIDYDPSDYPNGFNLGGDFTQEYLDEYLLNWIGSPLTNQQIYSITEGYMYSWDSLKNGADGHDATTEGITIRYGLRTLEPGEQTVFISDADTDKTGSVVYCNVLYFGTDEGILDGTNTMLYDFARPCPTFCNQ